MLFTELEMPDNMPVMTLPKTVLFPGAILPLVIYEDRYKKMLDVALEGDRFFGVVSLDERNTEIKETEPYYETACLGIIRACQKNSDGTSNILIQGLRRVHIEKTLQDFPFRKVEISLLDSESSLPNPSLDYLKPSVNYVTEAVLQETARRSIEDAKRRRTLVAGDVDNHSFVMFEATASREAATAELRPHVQAECAVEPRATPYVAPVVSQGRTTYTARAASVLQETAMVGEEACNSQDAVFAATRQAVSDVSNNR